MLVGGMRPLKLPAPPQPTMTAARGRAESALRTALAATSISNDLSVSAFMASPFKRAECSGWRVGGTASWLAPAELRALAARQMSVLAQRRCLPVFGLSLAAFGLSSAVFGCLCLPSPSAALFHTWGGL